MQDDAQPNLSFWKSAIPMQRAALAFAPKKSQERWRALQQTSAIEAAKISMAEAQEKGLTGNGALAAIFANPVEILSQRTQLEKELEAEILHHVKSGALLGFGFEMPRRVSSTELEIPPAAWRGKLDWTKGIITHESLTFVEVRLIAATKHQSLLGAALDQVVSATKPVQMGRPGMAADIAEAFFALRKGGKYDLNISLRMQCDMIRDWLIHRKPDSGYNPDRPGYDAIRRHLNPLIKAEKSCSKLSQH